MIEQQTQAPGTNRGAIISILAAILTILALCGGVVPVPLTAFVCFPAAAALGFVAFLTGLTALRKIRSSGENGRTLALTGTVIGGGSVAATLCLISLGIWLFPHVAALIHQYLR